jgi:hypothetical protein
MQLETHTFKLSLIPTGLVRLQAQTFCKFFDVTNFQLFILSTRIFDGGTKSEM